MSLSKSKNKVRDLILAPGMAEKFFHIAGTIILVLDMKGKIVLINPKGEEVLGRSADDLVGNNWFTKHIPTRNQKKMKEELFLNLKELIKKTGKFQEQLNLKVGFRHLKDLFQNMSLM